MRIAIFSGALGNAAALRAVLDAIDAIGADQIFALGDHVARGPKPRKVLDRLGCAERRARADRGDGEASEEPQARPAGRISVRRRLRAAGKAHRPITALASRSDRAALLDAPSAAAEGGRANGQALKARHRELIAGLPETARLEVDGASLFFSPGPPPGEAALGELLARARARVVAIGGGREPEIREVGDGLLISPGDLGIPGGGDPRAPFVVLELAPDAPPRAVSARVPYPLDATVRALDRRVRRGEANPEEALAYLEALLGRRDERIEEPLRRDDAGSSLLVKLLARRARDVYVQGAEPWPDDDVERVHDLRVAARRLREALAIGSPIMPHAPVRRARRRARAFATQLGERRVIDVFLRELQREPLAGLDGATRAIEALEARRDRATEVIRERFPREKLVAHGLDVLALSMAPSREDLTLADLAGPQLEALTDVAALLLPAIADPAAATLHHELRIALKHLRYAVEILGEPFAEELQPEETIGPLRAIQDVLGSLNDANELGALVRELDGEVASPLARHLEARAHDLHAEARDRIDGTGRAIVARLASAAARSSDAG